jgi:hypothetical protein
MEFPEKRVKNKNDFAKIRLIKFFNKHKDLIGNSGVFVFNFIGVHHYRFAIKRHFLSVILKLPYDKGYIIV